MTNIHEISKHLEILARDCEVMELPYLIAAVDKVLKDIKQLEAPRTWTEVKYHGGQIVADCGCYRHSTPPASSRNDGVQSKRRVR
jgi:hypothetical protein